MASSSFHLNERAVSRIAEVAALEVPGCVRLDAKLAGLAGRGLPRVESRINRVVSSVVIEAEIAASYPSPVARVTEVVREAITSHVEAQTGLEVSRVDITVANAVASGSLGLDGRVTRDEVNGHPTFFVTTPVTVKASTVSSPVTKPRKELMPVEVTPTLDGIRSPEVAPHGALAPVRTPEPVSPAAVEAPEPVEPVAVHAPAPVEPVVVEAPEPVQLRDVTVTPTRIVPVVAPAVEVRHVKRPAPAPVRIPRAPRPQPLRPVTIQPVVKYFDA